MLSRRQFIRSQTAAGAGLALALPAWAQFRVEISGVGATQLPIAIVKFRDEERATPSLSLSAIVRADLERSGVFRNIDAPGPLDEAARPAMTEWRSRAADALVAGSISRLADGRFDVRFKLWDVVKGNELGGQSQAVDAGDLRLAAHRIADFIYEKLTGDKGVFSTRIAYVTRAGNRYALRIADADSSARSTFTAPPWAIGVCRVRGKCCSCWWSTRRRLPSATGGCRDFATARWNGSGAASHIGRCRHCAGDGGQTSL